MGVSVKDPNLVVLIRTDGIGDFVLWLDSARLLRQHFSDKKIVLVANQIFAELAKQAGYFDQVIEIDLKAFEGDLRYRFGIMRKVRKLGAEVAIHPIYSRRFWEGDALARATGAEECVGSSGDLSYISPRQRRTADRWYSRLIPAAAGQLMELERNSEFLHGLDIEGVKPVVPRIPHITGINDSFGIENDYFIVFPGAGHSRRMWSVESFGVVARTIAEEYGWQMVVCGSSSEADTARGVMDEAGLKGSYDLSGKTSLPEFVELVRGSKLLIGNETSAVHIAAAVGTSSLCLLGGGHFERFMPYPESIEGIKPVAVFERMECFGCNWLCVLPHREGDPAPCIEAIRVKSVMDAVQHAIAERV